MNDFLDMMDAAIEGVKMRGKATVGEHRSGGLWARMLTGQGKSTPKHS